MDGKMLTKIIGERLDEMGISVADFCEELGISQSAYSQWKRLGRMPKPERIKQIEKCLKISFADFEQPTKDDEMTELLELIRTRPDLGVLLRSARNAPPSSVYTLVAQLEKEREGNL